MGKYEDLEQLKLLKEEGTITDEEFEIQKYKILSNTNEKKTTEGIYIATLVLGIFTFLLGWVPILGLILGIIAAVLCAKSRKKLKNEQDKSGLVTAGLVFTILGWVSVVIITFALVAGLVTYLTNI